MFCKADTRDEIIAAAKSRFIHYGYDKTTMAELARDCNMSPGNLYRFFPGKLDIAEAIAQDAVDMRFQEAEALARRDDLTPIEKLRELLFFELRETYGILKREPRALDIARTIARERPDFAMRLLHRTRSLIAEILAAGNAQGLFSVNDIVFTAEMIQAATMKYAAPHLWGGQALETLERELSGIFSLLINGLSGPSGVKLGLPGRETVATM